MGSSYFDAHSLWQRSEKSLFTPLHGNLEVDTCIVGAGIAGLTVAYMLAREGQKVVVLDRERLGLGETGLTSAHLSSALDERFRHLIRLHGRTGARLAYESHAAAIDLIEKIQRDENIACDFTRVNGYLFLKDGGEMKSLVEEQLACEEIGFRGTKIVERAPTRLFDTGPALVYPNQGQFHPLKYLDGLAYRLQEMGVGIYTHSEVKEIKGGKFAHVTTSQGFTVTARDIVVATNVPVNNLVTIHTKNSAYRSYMIGLAVPPSAAAVPMLLWDTDEPYRYLRFVKDPGTGEDLLLVGGEDHRTGQDTTPERHFEALHRWVENRVGLSGRVVVRWSGQIMEPVDGLAYIGHNPGAEENVYVVTGDSGHGLTHGTLAGPLLADLILGRENPWAEIYNPSRLHMRSLIEYMREAAQSTVPYGDWFTQGDVADVHHIEAGEGAVLRDGLSKIAVYKDELNRTHSFSAVCPHLGGIVRWNSAEKTWDCPCHGSRFDRFGQCLNGPAIKELTPVSDPAETGVEIIEGPLAT